MKYRSYFKLLLFFINSFSALFFSAQMIFLPPHYCNEDAKCLSQCLLMYGKGVGKYLSVQMFYFFMKRVTNAVRIRAKLTLRHFAVYDDSGTMDVWFGLCCINKTLKFKVGKIFAQMALRMWMHIFAWKKFRPGRKINQTFLFVRSHPHWGGHPFPS